MELICGNEQAAELYSAEVGALQGGTWRLGGAPAARFVAPLETKGARTGALASLGAKMIATGENYEEKLLAAAGK